MRKLYLLVLFVISVRIFGQSPERINYQGLLRNAAGEALANQNISIQFVVLQGAAPGTAVFTEVQSLSTNSLGLITTQIGQSQNLGTVNFYSGTFSLQVSVDLNAGSNFVSLGAPKLIGSVPFALHANSVPATFSNNVLSIGNNNSFTLSAPYSPSLSLSGSQNNVLSDGSNTVSLNTYTVGNGLLMSGGPDFTISSTATNPSITGNGLALVIPGAGSSFTVDVPTPTLSSNNNTLTLTQGTAVTTATVPVTPQTSVTGSGVANITTAGTNSFNVNVPTTTLVASSNTLTLTQGTVISTAIVPAQIQSSVTTSGIASVTTAGTNSFNIGVPAPVLAANANTLILTQGTAVTTATVPVAPQASVTGSGVANITSAGTNSFNVNVPTTTLVASSNTLTLTQGTVISTAIVPAQIQSSVTTSGIASVTTAGTNTFNVGVPAPVLAANVNTLTLTQGTAVTTATVPVAPQASVTGSGVANITSAGTNSFNVNVPTTTLVASSNTLTLTQGTVISTAIVPAQIQSSVTTSGIASVTTAGTNTFNVGVPAPVLAANVNTLTLTQGTAVTTATVPVAPQASVTGSGVANITSAGTNSFNVNVPTTTLVASSNTLTLTQGTVISTAIVPAQIQSSVTTSGIASVTTAGTNSFNIGVPAPVLTANANTLTITQGTAVTTATVPVTPQSTLTGSGIATVSTAGTNSFNISVPAPNIVISQTAGVAAVSSLSPANFSINIPPAVSPSITGGGIAVVSPTTGNVFTVTVAQPTFAYSQTTGSLSSGTASAYITPSLSLSGGTISVGPASNSIALNTGTNAFWNAQGNVGTNTTVNFVGTTDNVALIFRTNNIRSGRIDPSGPVFLGFEAGILNTDLNNAGFGHRVMRNNTSGSFNTATGYQALFANNTGSFNTANGFQALYLNTIGVENTALGYRSLEGNTTGSYNTSSGSNALLINSSGSNNVASGWGAMRSNSSGSSNSAFGALSLYFNSIGNLNTAAGYQSLHNNSTGSSNAAFGYRALNANTTGNANAAFGPDALLNNTIGIFNSAFGLNSSRNNVSGTGNASFGRNSLHNNTTGNNNVALGYEAGLNALGSSNVFIGNSAGYFETGSNKLYISNNSSSVTPLIYGDFSSGYLGINTTTVTEALTVEGNARISGAFMPGNNAGTSGEFLVSSGSGIAPTWASINSGTAALWSAVGNAGTNPTTNFIGTTDNNALNFRVNNLRAGTINNVSFNTAFGFESLNSVTTGTSNTAVGAQALQAVTTGQRNIAVGPLALQSALTGGNNVAMGYSALRVNNSINNIAIGTSALGLNTSGNSNVAIGLSAMGNNVIGNYNTAVGHAAGGQNTGFENVFLGYSSGAQSTGSGNVFLGFQSGYFETGNDKLYIANSTTSVSPLIYGNFATGNVGIGTTNANAPLQFSNSIAGRKIVMWELANNSHQYYGFGIDVNALRYQVDASVANHIFYSGINAGASQELMRIQGNRRIGINNAAPTATLDVVGTVKITDGTQATGRVLTSDAVGNASWATPAAPSHVRSIVIEPGMMDISAAYAVIPASKTVIGGWQRPCVIFPDGTTTQVQLNIPIPSDWNAVSSFTVRILYGSPSTTGNFDMQTLFSTISLNQSAVAASFGGGFVLSPNAVLEGLSEHTTVVTTAATNRLFMFTLRRNGGTGSDTSTSPMRLFGIIVDYMD